MGVVFRFVWVFFFVILIFGYIVFERFLCVGVGERIRNKIVIDFVFKVLEITCILMLGRVKYIEEK